MMTMMMMAKVLVGLGLFVYPFVVLPIAAILQHVPSPPQVTLPRTMLTISMMIMIVFSVAVDH